MSNVIDIMERINKYAKENSVNADDPKWMYQEQLAKIMKKFADKEGTTFHAFVINLEDEEGNIEPAIYMNNNMISDMTGIDISALRYHYYDDTKREDLSDCDGMMTISGSQLKEEIITNAESVGADSLSDCYIPAHFDKSTIVYKDNSSYILNSKKINILSLKSVMKLMSMLTQTRIAKEFRNFVLNELVLGEIAQETTEEYFEQLFDKDNIILYSNNTEKLLELLDISYKYDIAKGIINQDVDPMKDKIRKIERFKKEFKHDIVQYENEIANYKRIDEDIFFEQISSLENKIEETNRIIQALSSLANTLLLRLNIIAKTVKKLASTSSVAEKFVEELEPIVRNINKITSVTSEDHLPAIKGAWRSAKLNEILINEIKLVDINGIYGYTVAKQNAPSKPLYGHTISKAWQERYSKEFINSIQSNQDRNGNSQDKYIRWTPFGIKLIGIILEEYYLSENEVKPEQFLQYTEGDWEQKVYDRYLEEQKRGFAI